MSVKFIVSSIFLSFFLLSCGLRPIYQINKDYSYQQDLAAIKITLERKKINQDLQSNLEKVFNPSAIEVDTKYLLNVTLRKSLSSTFTSYSGSSGRNRVTLVANYKLIDLGSDKIIATGTTSASDDFDVFSKKFANYVAEDYITTNLTLIIADNIRNLLINDMVSNHQTK
jgi:LPS-assembly lipoprotein